MKIVIAPDSFKDSLAADVAASAINRGLRSALPAANLIDCPLADGGEGTLRILQKQLHLELLTATVSGANQKPSTICWGWQENEKLALLELAEVAGLQTLKQAERNPMHTTTQGLGELIILAAAKGAKKMVLAIGGSSTNDLGVGMASALGFEFFDHRDQKIAAPTGKDLLSICKIIPPKNGDWKQIDFEVICDVDNALLGPRGTARTYAQQKGASLAEVEHLEKGGHSFAGVLQKTFGRDFTNVPGAGAAGGMGAGTQAFLQARLQPGIQTVLQLINFRKIISEADYIITGEGQLDEQTFSGKTVHGVCQLAKEKQIPVIGLFGKLSLDKRTAGAIGLHTALSINPPNTPLSLALKNAEIHLQQKAKLVASQLINIQ